MSTYSEVKNKLIIIGNGFDLANGLKTSYSDFIVWYLNKVMNAITNNINYDDELMNIRVTNKILFNEKREIRLAKDFHEFLECFGHHYRCNFKATFFKRIIETCRELSWVDFEAEYYHALLLIYKNIESYGLDKSRSSEEYKKLEILNREFELIRNELEVYLTEVDNLRETNEIIENIFLSDFRDNTPGLFDLGKVNVCFLNFNYTSTVTKYINLLPRNNSKIIHIHGVLKNLENPIVFGYGDETDHYYKKIEDLNSNYFLKHFKSFGYFRNSNYQNLLSYIDSEKYEVSIMGHSCGLSDRVLLNTIFEHDNCHKIKIYYRQKNGNENNFASLTQEISRHFKDKEKMRKRIVPYNESKPFSMSNSL